MGLFQWERRTIGSLFLFQLDVSCAAQFGAYDFLAAGVHHDLATVHVEQFQ